MHVFIHILIILLFILLAAGIGLLIFTCWALAASASRRDWLEENYWIKK